MCRFILTQAGNRQLNILFYIRNFACTRKKDRFSFEYENTRFEDRDEKKKTTAQYFALYNLHTEIDHKTGIIERRRVFRNSSFSL